MRVLVPPGTHSSHPTCKPVHDLFQRHVGQHSNKQERLLKETRGLGGELPDGTVLGHMVGSSLEEGPVDGGCLSIRMAVC